MARVEVETSITAPIERCFDLARSVDVQQQTMAQSGDRAVAGVTTGTMEFDDFVTWETRHFGLRYCVTSQITEYKPPHRFVLDQIDGPFTTFQHIHEFSSHGETTRMISALEYRPPYRWIGALADHLFLRRYLLRLLRTRSAFLKTIAESGESRI